VGGNLPIILIARHGETAWSLTGQHTGLTDLPLTEAGERNARRLVERLKGLPFAKVLTSPLQRAARTTHPLPMLSSTGRQPANPWWTFPPEVKPALMGI
jgi:broad specificity phosphatase PhoE